MVKEQERRKKGGEGKLYREGKREGEAKRGERIGERFKRRKMRGRSNKIKKEKREKVGNTDRKGKRFSVEKERNGKGKGLKERNRRRWRWKSERK
jgi:hypothetical protein